MNSENMTEIQSRNLSNSKPGSKFKILTITICEQVMSNIISSRASIILIVYIYDGLKKQISTDGEMSH